MKARHRTIFFTNIRVRNGNRNCIGRKSPDTQSCASDMLARNDQFRMAGPVVSKYVGANREKPLACVRCRKKCGAVLFFDEADGLFGNCREVKDGRDRYASV